MMPLSIFQLAPVQRRQPRHLRRLRGARRRLLPARRVPADLARLLADRRRRRVAAGDGADARCSRRARARWRSASAPRIPLTVGPLVIAAGMLLMTRIDPGDELRHRGPAGGDRLRHRPDAASSRRSRRPCSPPPTPATRASPRGSTTPSRGSAGLLAVAVLPLIAGLTGDAFYDPAAMADGFHIAMVACAALSALGGLLAWLTIENDVLAPRRRAGGAEARRVLVLRWTRRRCGTPRRSRRPAQPPEAPPPAAPPPPVAWTAPRRIVSPV